MRNLQDVTLYPNNESLCRRRSHVTAPRLAIQRLTEVHAEHFMGLTNLLKLRYINCSGIKTVNAGNYPLVHYVILILFYWNFPSLTEGISGGGVHFGGYSGHSRAPWQSGVISRVACFSPQVNECKSLCSVFGDQLF